MKITEFIQTFKERKITNTKLAPNAVQEYIVGKLDITPYISFNDKKQIAEMIVEKYTTEVNGIKKHDSISAYVGFVGAMINAHTSLEFSEDVIGDYDLLVESGLLPHIIDEFRDDYNESEVLLKMTLTSELEDNNINVLIGRFLDKVLKKLDSVEDIIQKVNPKDLLGVDIKQEDVAALSGLLDKLK